MPDHPTDPPRGSIALYTDADGVTQLEVRFDGDTVWLTQKQMADLFGVTVPNIAYHLKQVFESGELEQTTSVQEILIHLDDKRRYTTQHYNLDAIIAVGYRVNSIRATRFRQWATGVLGHYVRYGFVLDQAKLLTDEIVQVFDRMTEEIRQLRLAALGRTEVLRRDEDLDVADLLDGEDNS